MNKLRRNHVEIGLNLVAEKNMAKKKQKQKKKEKQKKRQLLM